VVSHDKNVLTVSPPRLNPPSRIRSNDIAIPDRGPLEPQPLALQKSGSRQGCSSRGDQGVIGQPVFGRPNGTHERHKLDPPSPTLPVRRSRIKPDPRHRPDRCPTCAPCSTRAAAARSGWVEPQFSFILKPLGRHTDLDQPRPKLPQCFFRCGPPVRAPFAAVDYNFPTRPDAMLAWKRGFDPLLHTENARHRSVLARPIWSRGSHLYATRDQGFDLCSRNRSAEPVGPEKLDNHYLPSPEL